MSIETKVEVPQGPNLIDAKEFSVGVKPIAGGSCDPGACGGGPGGACQGACRGCRISEVTPSEIVREPIPNLGK